MICLSKNKQAIEIINTLALCGEIPYCALNMIPYESRHYLLRVMRQLKNERYISITGQGKYKSVRLLKGSLEFLKSENVGYAEQYSERTDNGMLSGKLQRKSREMRIAETLLVMHLSGAMVETSEKPKLTAASSVQASFPPQPYLPRQSNGGPPAAEKPAADARPAAERAALKQPLFFTSKEIKRNDIEGIYKTENARAVGLYVTPAGWYGVFNLGDGLCEWNTASEAKSCEQMRMTCKVNGWLDGSRIMERNSIIIARNTDVAVRMMRVTDEAAGGVRFRADGKSTRNRYIRFDETYDTSFFVPANENGARMLRILAAPNFRDRILEACLDDDIRLDPMKATVIADGRNAEGEYFYLFFDSELRRLRGFRDSMKIRNIPLSKCLVACFPWQEPIVREYLGEEARIKTIGMDAIEKAVFENT